MMANGMDWHNVPASERDPRTRTTRHDVGSVVVVKTVHPDGHESVGVVHLANYGLPPMRKGE
jgi:hypothetical protein